MKGLPLLSYLVLIIFCMFISKAAVGFSSFHASSTCGLTSPSTPTFTPLIMAAPTRPSMKLGCVVAFICQFKPKFAKNASKADLISVKLAFA